LGVGGGGLGVGVWGLGPNPKSAIPNPQSPIPNIFTFLDDNDEIIASYYLIKFNLFL